MELTQDKALQRMAVYAVLNSTVQHDRNEDYSLRPPTDIAHTSYLYEQSDDTGKLYMQYYSDFSEDERQMCVAFDADSILYYEEPDPYKEGIDQPLN